jgi:hypothetical protein
MALREISINDEPILIEVTDLQIEGQPDSGRFEFTDATKKIGDMKERLDQMIKGLTAPVQDALRGAGADEWTLEISIGFKGGTGLPFIASGEANAALKVSAKWKKA